MTYNEIIRRLNNIRRRLSMNSKDDIENEKALESAIEMFKGVTSGTIVPIEWHEIKMRPLTDEERAAVIDGEFEFIIDDGCDYYLDCHLPDNDEPVLIAYDDAVLVDVFHRDVCCCWFEDYDICDVKAWARMPKLYKKT